MKKVWTIDFLDWSGTYRANNENFTYRSVKGYYATKEAAKKAFETHRLEEMAGENSRFEITEHELHEWKNTKLNPDTFWYFWL